MKNILVIDDDVPIGDLLEEVLTRAGYGVGRAYSGTEALYALDRQRPALVLLDLMLPGLSGEEVLKRIKGIPVIVLSARADTRDKVTLLLDGAADYMTKPFDPDELLARIAVQLRHRPAPALLCAGGLTLDTRSRTVTAGDAPVHLTPTEFAILKILMENPGQVISRGTLLDRMSLDTPDGTENSLKQHISNLRKKLRAADDVDHIEAVWGIGFRLTGIS